MNSLEDPRALASLLIFEIGNSHIAVATCINGEIRTGRRFEHDGIKEIARYAQQAWAALPDDFLKAAAAASVVPAVLDEVRRSCTERLDTPILEVGEDLHRPLSLALEDPDSVGIDRLCCAAAAYDQVREACVTASFGTAVTVDCVNAQGVFMGGAILPGVDLQARVLHDGTAALPRVTIEPTDTVYGTSTEQAICNGIIFGLVGSLREITERYATDLGAWPRLIITGGNAEVISRHCDFVDAVVPDLAVRGIALAYRKHFAPFDDDG